MKQRARLSFIARKKEIPKNENLRFANFQTKFDRYFSYRLLHACEQTIVLFHISRTIFLINNGQFSRRFFEPDLRKTWIYIYMYIFLTSFDRILFDNVNLRSILTEGNFTARRYWNELFVYSHPLLLVQRISIREIDDVVDEQVGQQFSPD